MYLECVFVLLVVRASRPAHLYRGDGTRAQISASVSVWCRPAVSREHGDVMHMVSGRPCLVLGDPLAIISILESLPFSTV